MDKSEKIWSWLGNFINLYTLLGVIGGLFGGGAVITYLNELPFWVPLILGVISIGLIAISLTTKIVSYKKWKAAIEERKKVIEEKRADLLSIPDTLWKLSVEQLNIVKALIDTGITTGMSNTIKESLRIRLKLPTGMLPRTIAEDMETTFRVMEKRDIKIKKPQNIIKTGLIIGWIMDEHRVGIKTSEISQNNQKYREVRERLESQLTKVSSKELKDAITMFRNVLLSGDSSFTCKAYFLGINIPVELKEYDTSIPEFEHTREVEIQDYLAEIKKLAEIECKDLGE